MANTTLADRIGWLEGFLEGQRADMPFLAPGNQGAAFQLLASIEYLEATLVVLRRRQAGRHVTASAVPSHRVDPAPRRTERLEAYQDVSPRNTTLQHVAVSAIPSRPVVYSEGQAFEIVWPPRVPCEPIEARA